MPGSFKRHSSSRSVFACYWKSMADFKRVHNATVHCIIGSSIGSLFSLIVLTVTAYQFKRAADIRYMMKCITISYMILILVGCLSGLTLGIATLTWMEQINIDDYLGWGQFYALHQCCSKLLAQLRLVSTPC